MCPVWAVTDLPGLDPNRTFIASHNPEFRPLLRYREESLAKIPANAGDERRYAEMQRIRTEWRIELNEKARAAIDSTDQAAFKALLGELTDSASSDLAQYVAHRKWVIDLLDKCLRRDTEGRYALEAQPHDILWPRRTSSDDDVWYDSTSAENLKRHNLWILDERLAFHHYLASDLQFSQLPQGLAINDNRERADILVYDVPSAFIEGTDDEIRSVTIIELKRPERTDSNDPIQQALDYTEKIRQHGAQDPATGQRFRVSPNTRFYCYVCATLTDSIRRFARLASLVEAPDGLGYFGYNTNFFAYVEVLDWQKVLRDAKRRNRAWFDIAGLQ